MGNISSSYIEWGDRATFEDMERNRITKGKKDRRRKTEYRKVMEGTRFDRK